MNLPFPVAPDHACWQAHPEQPGPLLALEWGIRRFGGSSAAKSRREGWTYAVVAAGSPGIVQGGRRREIRPSTLVVVGPESAARWEDSPAGPCRVFSWTWRQPSASAAAWAQAGAFVVHPLAAEEVTGLRQLHLLCRGELHRNDAHSMAALGGVQMLLETRIARIRAGASDDPRQELLDRGLEWVRANLSTRQPLARLADFLGVSPATVQRLFRDRLGTTVMRTVADLRRTEAERMLLGEGVMIKEVAFRLGYRHPHDFSRAFRKFTGSLPSRQGLRVG